MAAVDRVGSAVHAAVLQWAEAFIARVMRDIVPGIVRQDATEDDIADILNALDDPEVARGLLASAFKSVDAASSDDLRVIGVQTSSVVRNAEELQAEWLRQSTDLIRATEDVRRRVERILKDPISEGRSVDDIRGMLIEQAGYAASRAELTARTVTLQTYGKIQEQRQRDAGFTKYVWTTSLDERVREDHAELDGTVQEWDDPPIVDRRSGRRGHPGSDFQCLPPNSQVAFASPINRAFRRRYRGQATLLITDSGETLQCTPNHPVLTASGWKAAQAVQVGEYVLKARLDGSPLFETQIQHREAAISDVFEALSLVFGLGRQRTVASEFHDDAGVDEQVYVVDVDRKLRLNLEASSVQELSEFALPDSDAARLAARNCQLVLAAVGTSAHCSISGLRDRLALFFGRCREAGYVGSTTAARLHTVTDQECANRCPRDPVALREAFDRGALPLHLQAFVLREWLGVVRLEVDATASVLGDAALAEAFRVASQVSGNVRPGAALEAFAVRVVETRIVQFDCHVFNVSSACDWYVAQQLFVHNCRCSAVPYVDPDDESA